MRPVGTFLVVHEFRSSIHCCISHAPLLHSTNVPLVWSIMLHHICTLQIMQKHALLTDQMICWCADRYVAAQAPLTGPRLDAFVTAHQGPLAELDYENICCQVQHTFIHSFFLDCSIHPSMHSFFLSFLIAPSILSFFLIVHSFIHPFIHPSIHPSMQ